MVKRCMGFCASLHVTESGFEINQWTSVESTGLRNLPIVDICQLHKLFNVNIEIF